ncbi:MAG: CHAD domain-containing protein [Bryobacteraceae bacterium]
MTKGWNRSATPGENAGALLPPLARDYLRGGRAAVNPECTWAEMHRFRLISKRFRYTLEIFREFYDDGIDERIAAVRRVQTVLGDGNDCEATLQSGAAADHREFAAWLRDRQRRLEHEFRNVWHAEFDGRGEDYWIGYLGSPRS